MILSERDKKTICSALEDAISDRQSFLDSLRESHGQREIMSGFAGLAKKTVTLLKRYKRLQAKLWKDGGVK